MERKSHTPKLALSYIVATVAGILSFYFALNLRVLVLMIVQKITAANNSLRWSYSFINAVTIIVLMLCWLVYVYYIQYHFEKKCGTKASFIRGLLIFILPMTVLTAALAIFFKILEIG